MLSFLSELLGRIDATPRGLEEIASASFQMASRFLDALKMLYCSGRLHAPITKCGRTCPLPKKSEAQGAGQISGAARGEAIACGLCGGAERGPRLEGGRARRSDCVLDHKHTIDQCGRLCPLPSKRKDRSEGPTPWGGPSGASAFFCAAAQRFERFMMRMMNARTYL